MQPVAVQRDEDSHPPKKPSRKDRDMDSKPSRIREEDQNDEYDREKRDYGHRSEGKPKKPIKKYDDDEEDDQSRAGRRGPGYDSTSREDEGISPSRRGNNEDRWGEKKVKETRREREEKPVAPLKSVVRPLDLSNMKAFLTQPLPKDVGVVQCYIRRNKSGTNKLFPTYTLYLKDGDRFLMCSKKRPNNKTSNYLISMGENDLNRSSSNYLGKLRSNFMGTEFQIFDDGYNPKEERGGAGGKWTHF